MLLPRGGQDLVDAAQVGCGNEKQRRGMKVQSLQRALFLDVSFMLSVEQPRFAFVIFLSLSLLNQRTKGYALRGQGQSGLSLGGTLVLTSRRLLAEALETKLICADSERGRDFAAGRGSGLRFPQHRTRSVVPSKEDSSLRNGCLR